MNSEMVEKTEKLCAVFALFTNLIILHLIYFKSPKSLGSYKKLMIYIAIFELFYAFFNFTSPSQILTKDSGYLVLMDRTNSLLPAEIVNPIYFGMFGTSLANFGTHFVYRYLTINGKLKYISTNCCNVFIWIITPLLLGTAHTILSANVMRECEQTEQFLRTKILNVSNETSISKYSFLGSYIFPVNEEGSEYTNWKGIFGVLAVSVLIVFSIAIMSIFGIKGYKSLKKLTDSSPLSLKYKSIENQLFFALVVQTIIPLCLMHIPSTLIAITCFLNAATSAFGPICSITIAIHMVLDPLPNIFLIKSYRNAIFDTIFFWKEESSRSGTRTGQIRNAKVQMYSLA